MTLRTDLSAVREIGRATQGVRLIKLEENDKVVAEARLVPEEDSGEKGEAIEGAESTEGTESAEGKAQTNAPEATDDGPESNDYPT